jgi:predicted DCC family thiol-disulfide oxidoreductase YuxK
VETSPNDTRVIVYDGYCHVCVGGARFHLRHATNAGFRLVPMQSEEGRALLAQNGIDAEDPATFLVLDRGRKLTESTGALHVITDMGGAWRLFAVARVVPRGLRDALYRLLARNRYRWFGKRATCYLPPPS